MNAMKDGAFDYLTKPFSITEIETRLKRFFEINHLRQENHTLKKKLKTHTDSMELVGQSPQLQQVMSVVELVGHSDATVLIQGESGTGKELIASAVHRHSDRADMPFLQINCAAIPENLMESTFFGHVQGAFTGANKTTKGIFEETDGGTLLLDEVSEIPIGLQAKLLRVLQEQTFTKVGSHKPVHVNVRIISTTNKNILDMVENGTFREDLYYRLNVVPIYVPPLRDRTNDAPLLLSHFVNHFCEKYNLSPKKIASDTLKQLENYPWPGNIREMKNNTERAVLFATNSDEMRMEHFFPPEPAGATSSKVRFAGTATVAEVEREAIMATLDRTGQNRTQAAKILDISVKTLRNKLKSYGIEHATDE